MRFEPISNEIGHIVTFAFQPEPMSHIGHHSQPPGETMSLAHIEPVIPNDSLKLVGRAYLSTDQEDQHQSVGSAVRTMNGALLLWMNAFPIKNGKATILFDTDMGQHTQSIGVLLDPRFFKPDFEIGTVTFASCTAELSFFAVPTFFATMLIQSPADRSPLHVVK